MTDRINLTGIPGVDLVAGQLPAIYRGDDEEITVIIKEGTPPAAVPITGRVFTAQIRKTADSSTVLASFTCVNTDDANGEVTCTLTSEDSALLPPGGATWDFQEDNGGVITTLIVGKVKVIGDVTRPEVVSA